MNNQHVFRRLLGYLKISSAALYGFGFCRNQYHLYGIGAVCNRRNYNNIICKYSGW